MVPSELGAENRTAERSVPEIVVFSVQAPNGDGATEEIEANVRQLAAGSPAFRSMFSDPWLSCYKRDPENSTVVFVPIHDVHPESFQNVIRFIEKGNVTFYSTAVALETLCTSLRFLATDLSRICVECLSYRVSSRDVLHVLDVVTRFCPVTATASPAPSTTTSTVNLHRHVSRDRLSSSIETFHTAKFLATSSRKSSGYASSEDLVTSSCAQGRGAPAPVDFAALSSSCDALAARCLCLIAADAENQLRDECWEELGPDAVRMVLALDTLCVRSEAAVTDALVRWACYRCKTLSKEPTPENIRYVLPADILFSVRLYSLSPADFVEFAARVSFSSEELAFVLSILVMKQTADVVTGSNNAWACSTGSSCSTIGAGADGSFSPVGIRIPSTLAPHASVISRPRLGSKLFDSQPRRKRCRQKRSAFVDTHVIEEAVEVENNYWLCSWMLPCLFKKRGCAAGDGSPPPSTLEVECVDVNVTRSGDGAQPAGNRESARSSAQTFASLVAFFLE